MIALVFLKSSGTSGAENGAETMAQWDEIQVNEEDRKAIDNTKALIEQRMARLRNVV